MASSQVSAGAGRERERERGTAGLAGQPVHLAPAAADRRARPGGVRESPPSSGQIVTRLAVAALVGRALLTGGITGVRRSRSGGGARRKQ